MFNSVLKKGVNGISFQRTKFSLDLHLNTTVNFNMFNLFRLPRENVYNLSKQKDTNEIRSYSPFSLEANLYPSGPNLLVSVTTIEPPHWNPLDEPERSRVKDRDNSPLLL